MAENYILLETINLTQTASSVTFNNLPSTGYTDLKIVASYRGSGSNVYEVSNLRFNGLNANLSSKTLEGSGTSADSVSNAQIYFGAGNGATSTANTFCNIEAYIPNYTSGNQKSVTVHSVGENNANLAYTQLTSGLWADVASITSIEIVPANSFLANSTFSLYAIAATGTTPVTAPFARGGNIVANDGTYWYHAFLSSGTFTPLKALSCDYLVVAGGGGGGNQFGGGGGAGGLRSTVTQTGGNTAGVNLESALSLTSGTGYAVTIGAGGTAGANGNNSVFGSITSTAGGRGATYNAISAGNGGSGGGGGGSNGSTFKGLGTANQGFDGTDGATSGNYGAGGGGGAGAVGGTPSTNSGVGGAGVAISSFAVATNTGVSNFYAGGGGGGKTNNGALGAAGGSGGGGAGSNSGDGITGTTNTGSGGGGAFGASGGAGGSGLVIIRYAMV